MTLVDIFSAQALATPHQTALLSDTETMTFGELDAASNRIAHALRQHGVQPKSLVAVSLDRSVDALVVLLGILKAGAAYLPVVTTLPKERQHFILNDARPVLFVGQAELAEAAVPFVSNLTRQELILASRNYPSTALNVQIAPSDVAWVIYTSGSTGVPKGVMGTHLGSVNRIRWLWQAYPFCIGEVAFQNTGFGTVDSVWEIFAPLGSGHALRIFDDDLLRDVERLIPSLAAYGIRRICLVPSLLATIVSIFPDLHSCASSIKTWVASGEPLSVELVRRFYQAAPGATLLNQYGLTESCADVTFYDTRALLPALQSGQPVTTVPIGHPIPGVEVFLLNESLQPAVFGEIAELALGGSCLAAGYLNRPEETARRFISIRHPEKGGLCAVYRTGDRVRMLDGGVLEYCGRLDRQVKIRGFRIELDEVEAVLSTFACVRHCAVAYLNELERPRLVAWIAPAMDHAGIMELRQHLAAMLPSHMLPADIVCLDELPCTPTGKVDRAKLTISGQSTPTLKRATPDLSEVAEWLWGCYTGLLGVEVPAEDGDFFSLGGDSLLAIRLMSQVRRHFQCEIDLQVIFDYPRLRDLAVQISMRMNCETPAILLEFHHSAPDVGNEAVLTTSQLSYAQERIGVLAQLRDHPAIYNVSSATRLRGSLNVSALQWALDESVRRHEILRSRLVNTNAGWQCIVERGGLFPFIQVDAFGVIDEQRSAYARDTFANAAKSPLNLEVAAPMRAMLIRFAVDDHALLLTFHQSVTDDWSVSVLSEEICILYAARLRGEVARLPSEVYQYSKHAIRERRDLQGEHLAKLREFWEKTLVDAPRQLALPTDYSRPARASHRGDRVEVHLDKASTAAVRAFSEGQRASIFMTLLAAYQTYLCRYTGQRSIVVGSPVANRENVEATRSVGCFINMVAYRTELHKAATFLNILSQVRSHALDVLANQALPFEQIVEQAKIDRSLAFEPLFQTMLALRLGKDFNFDLPDVTANVIDLPVAFSEYDMSVWVVQGADQLTLQFDYAIDLFERVTVERIANGFVTLLLDAISNPNRQIDQLEIVAPIDKQLLLNEWQGERREWAQAGLTVAELVQRQVELTPERVAVRFGSDEMSYQALSVAIKRLRAILERRGVRQGHVVGVMIDRSPSMVSALLAVLEIGAAYLPIDPTHPPERVRHMLKDSRAVGVIGDTASILRLSTDLPVLNVEDPDRSARPFCVDGTQTVESDVCYIIYTSGSTGTPKGVKIRHDALLNLLLDLIHRVPIEPHDVFAAVTTISFDIAGLEIFAPLISGAELHLIPSQTAKDGQLLAHALVESKATILQGTPSTWRLLLDAGWRPPTKFKGLCGGEALPTDVAAVLAHPELRCFNVYGPTETTIWSTATRITGGSRNPIGRPISNTTAYILDAMGKLAPIGAIGELCIGGTGVAIGYQNLPDVTASRFVTDPFDPSPNARIYRTGDQVRHNAVGEIEYVGRADDQVKLRGHRIELGEVESVLQMHPDVDVAAVVVDRDRLAAHIVPTRSAAAIGIDLSLFFFGASSGHGSAVSAYELYIEAGRYADAAGFKAIWTPERHFHEVGGPYPNPSVLSATLAAITSKIHLRAGSVVLPLHDPIRVAEEWAVVDNLSGGRTGIAFASGWNARDFAFYPDRFDDRKSVLFEQIETVKSLWRGETIPALDGKFAPFQLRIFPLPVQAAIPIWITAAGPREVFAEAGRLGANILTHLLGQDVDELAEKIAIYRQARADYGHDRESGVVTVMLHTFLADSQDEAHAICRAPFLDYLKSHLRLDTSDRSPDQAPLHAKDEQEIIEAAWQRHSSNALIGSVDNCLRIVRQLTECGVNEIACLIDFGVSASEVLAHLPLLLELRAQASDVRRVDGSGLVKFLARNLPEYMIPEIFTSHASLPITLNGKLDRKRLLELTPITASFSRPAETDTEQILMRIWTDVLGGEIPGVTTSFFAAGGHSLTASRLIAQLRSQFGIDLPLRTIFDHPTIESMALHIDGLIGAGNQSKEGSIGTLRSNKGVPSFAQERLVFLHELASEKSLYNTAIGFKLSGSLNVPALRKALERLVKRHRLLSSRLRISSDAVTVEYDPEHQMTLEVTRIKDASVLRETVNEIAARAFDLVAECPFRAHLIQSSEREHILVYVVHHAVSDASSIGIINAEISQFYSAEINQDLEVTLQTPTDYSDYAVDQRDRMDAGQFEEGLTYWTKTLHDLPDRLELPADRPRQLEPSFRGAHHAVFIERVLAEELKQLGVRNNASLFMVVAALLQTLLHRYTSSTDIALGVPVTVRPQIAEGVVGLFLNTIVLRTDCSGTPPFDIFLQRVRDSALNGYSHQDVPFEKVVARTGVRRDASRHPLFQVMLVVHNADEPSLKLQEVSCRPIQIETKTSKFDITLSVAEIDGGLSLDFEYAVDLFDESRITKMACHLVNLARDAVARPDKRLTEMSMLADDELAWETKGCQRFDIKGDPLGTIHGLFDLQASKTPSATAVITETESYSYDWLRKRARCLAAFLQQSGIMAGDRVAVCLPRSANMIVTMLAVLEAGASYVPLDPKYPSARLGYIVENSRASVIVTNQEICSQVGFKDRAILIESLDLGVDTGAGFTDTSVSGGDVSHIIYTSGSTGQPKGVVITHTNTVSMLTWAHRNFAPEELACTLASTSICFDLSVFEIFAPLTIGGAVILSENFLALSDHPAKERVTLCNTVPSAMDAYLKSAPLPSSVFVVNLAGEPLHRRLSNRVYAHEHVRKLFNLYGPTECTTYSLSFLVPRSDQGEPAIGEPLGNTTAYVLDETLAPVPRGVAGELFLGGAGVAKCYFDRPDLTEAKFIDDPWSGDSNARLYATGDLVRRRGDGNFEYLGRKDRQIKLRGYRIELGEIEATVRAHPSIENAVALVTNSKLGPQLVCYVVAAGGEAVNPDVIKEWLSKRLPSMLIPSQVIRLEAMPLTPNQKIDVKALPAPAVAAQATSIPPTTLVEQQILEAWVNVLGHRDFGISDNFFDVGGTSLSLMQLRARIEEQTGRKFSVIDLFKSPTVRAQSNLGLEKSSANIAARQLDMNERVERRRQAMRLRATQ